MKTKSKSGMGTFGDCMCTKCDNTTPHQKGKPCLEEKCPECGAKMLRKGSYHHELFIQNKSR